MKRDYADGEKENVSFFTGIEVEHTPAYGMQTLFVAGLHSVEEIASRLQGCKHIFFGANHTFNHESSDTAAWYEWEKMITFFLDKGYWCSLDIPVHLVGEFNEGGLNEYRNFIPQIRVPIPYIKLWNYNTMLKIDDKDFNATNPGVWTHSLHSLMDRSKFTDWSQYSNDNIVK